MGVRAARVIPGHVLTSLGRGRGKGGIRDSKEENGVCGTERVEHSADD